MTVDVFETSPEATTSKTTGSTASSGDGGDDTGTRRRVGRTRRWLAGLGGGLGEAMVHSAPLTPASAPRFAVVKLSGSA